MCLGVHFCSYEAGNELHRDISEDRTVGRADDLVFEVHIHPLRRHLVRVWHLVGRLSVLVGEELEYPAVQLCRFAEVAPATYQLVKAPLLDHALPESLVGLPLGGFDELGEDRHETLCPRADGILLQLLCLLKHLLPVLGRAGKRDGRDAAGYIMDHIVEIALHGLHQRNLRGDALGDTSGSEVGGDGLGDVAFGGIVDLCREVGHQFLPVGIAGEQVLVGLHHEVHLP